MAHCKDGEQWLADVCWLWFIDPVNTHSADRNELSQPTIIGAMLALLDNACIIARGGEDFVMAALENAAMERIVSEWMTSN
jgi:hypothetical protein